MRPARLIAVALVILGKCDRICLAFVAEYHSAVRRPTTTTGIRAAPCWSKLMQSSCTEAGVAVDQSTPASAPMTTALSTPSNDDCSGQRQDYSLRVPSSNSFQSSVLPVLTAAMLLTSNTVGAGCLVLPEFVEGPGLAASAGIFLACYLVNLVSGLVIAEVAIKQRELSGADLSSASFKQFAEANLDYNPMAVHSISAVSLFVNGCIHAFDVSRAGLVGSALVNGAVPPGIVSCLWVTLLVSIVATQSSQRLSQAASFFVAVVFLSFGTVLLPGLAAISDPLTAFLQPGTATVDGTASWFASASQATPVILVALMYQNIVPTITKFLQYDRTKTVAALTLGSMIPLLMYLALSLAAVGGDLDFSPEGFGSGGLASVAMSVFSVSTLAGSSLGSSLSITEELESFRSGSEKLKTDKNDFSLSSVALASLIPLTAAMIFSGENGITGALGLAGSLGAPLLYGAIPAWLAWNQRQAHQRAFILPFDETMTASLKTTQTARLPPPADLVPSMSLPILGVLSMGFVGDGFIQRCGEFLAFAI